LFASGCLILASALLVSMTPGNAQSRRVSCGDPRVKDALMLAILERYQSTISGGQTREVGGMSPGHIGFTPEGNSICGMWVNVQANGRTVLAGTARFEIYLDQSGNVVASLL